MDFSKLVQFVYIDRGFTHYREAFQAACTERGFNQPLNELITAMPSFTKDTDDFGEAFTPMELLANSSVSAVRTSVECGNADMKQETIVGRREWRGKELGTIDMLTHVGIALINLRKGRDVNENRLFVLSRAKRFTLHHSIMPEKVPRPLRAGQAAVQLFESTRRSKWNFIRRLIQDEIGMEGSLQLLVDNLARKIPLHGDATNQYNRTDRFLRRNTVQSFLNADVPRHGGDLSSARPQRLLNSNGIRLLSFATVQEMDKQEYEKAETGDDFKFLFSLGARITPSMMSNVHYALIDVLKREDPETKNLSYKFEAWCSCKGGSGGSCSHCYAVILGICCIPSEDVVITRFSYNLQKERDIPLTRLLATYKQQVTENKKRKLASADDRKAVENAQSIKNASKNVVYAPKLYLPLFVEKFNRLEHRKAIRNILFKEELPFHCPLISCGHVLKTASGMADHVMNKHPHDWPELKKPEMQRKEQVEEYFRNQKNADLLSIKE